MEIKRKFQQFGEVKSVRAADSRIKSVNAFSGLDQSLINLFCSQRYVEMYDTRVCRYSGLHYSHLPYAFKACEEAHDQLRHQSLQDGVMDIAFAWDIPDTPLPNSSASRRYSLNFILSFGKR
jgi:hypothetical protein